MTIGNWYRVGTAAVQNGSATIVGTGTFWTSQCNPGDRFTVDGENWYEVASITDDTHLMILSVGGSGAFAGATASNIAYAIDRNFTNNLNANIAASVASLVAQYQANSNGPLSGLFQNGAVATPGIAFLNEISSGLFHPAAGIAALAVQGAEVLRAVGAAGGVPAMLGLGQAAPANGLDLLVSTNALWGARFQNTSGGTAARAGVQLAIGTQTLNVGVNGAGFASNGVLTASRGFLEGGSGLDFASGIGGTGLAFSWGAGAGYASVMNLYANGNLTVPMMNAGGPALAAGSVSITSSGTGTASFFANCSGSSGCLLVSNSSAAALDGVPPSANGIGTIGPFPLVFTQNGIEGVRLDPSRNLLVGVTSSSYHTIAKAVAEGTAIFVVTNPSTGQQSFSSFGVAGNGASQNGAAMIVNKNSSNNRSINLAGTMNTSGADYAEYRQLIPALYGMVAKGALLGYDSNGLMTNIFANVVGRVLPKSTAPSYVGGDTWGIETAIIAAYSVAAPGEQPSAVVPPSAPIAVLDPGPGATEAQAAAYLAYQAALFAYPGLQAEYVAYQADLAAYEARLTAFNAAMETERVKWDRIALCGVVPVTLPGVTATAADIGKYLVPCAAADGSITATLIDKADLTLGQYVDSLGTIEKINSDGRPLVNVKNS